MSTGGERSRGWKARVTYVLLLGSGVVIVAFAAYALILFRWHSTQIPYLTYNTGLFGYARPDGKGLLSLSWSDHSYYLWLYDNWSEEFGSPVVWGANELPFELDTPPTRQVCIQVLGPLSLFSASDRRTDFLPAVVLHIEGSPITGYGEVTAFKRYYRLMNTSANFRGWDVTLRMHEALLAKPIPIAECLVDVLESDQLLVRGGYKYYFVGSSEPLFYYNFPDRLTGDGSLPHGLALFYVWNSSQKPLTDEEEAELIKEGRRPRSLKPGEGFGMF